MRSDLVFRATTNVPNRYLLSQLASKAARKLHRPGARLQDTANHVLVRFSRANPVEREQASRKPEASPVRPQTKLPVNPQESKVVTIPPAGERSIALWEAARVPEAWLHFHSE
jgi:hypothetical protein